MSSEMTVTSVDRLSPMPTPHSLRRHRQGLRVMVVTVLLLVGPFLLLELGVRALIATGRLPTAPSHSEQLDIGLINVRRLDPQDVLLMGDSQFATGVDPAVLGRLLESELGRPVPVYNLAQPASPTDVNQLLLEFLAGEGRMPRVVIMDITLSSLAIREGPRRAGDVPRAADTARGADAARRPTLTDSALGREMTGCGAESEVVDRIDCELARLSAAWRWHGRPDRIVRAVLTGGHFELKERRGRLRPDGFFARTPVQPQRLQEQVVNGDYALYRVHPRFNQAEADKYRSFRQAVEDRGGRVIFVHVPLTKPYTEQLVSRNPRWEVERRAALGKLEAVIGQEIVYVEAYGDDWWSDTSLSDINHLSAEGAKAFTRQLWAMPSFRRQLLTGLDETSTVAALADGDLIPSDATDVETAEGLGSLLPAHPSSGRHTGVVPSAP